MKRVTQIAALALWASSGQAAEIDAAGLEALPSADVVILGEVHDNPVHHANQARAVAALAPAAVVFEMLTPEQAARVTPENRVDAARLGEVLGWEASGWPDFGAYHPIFTAAPGAAVLGGALPRGEVRRAMSEDAGSVFGEGAARYGLSTPLPPDVQDAQEALQMSAHCDALPEEMLPGMVAAQRLRDAAMARAVVEALEQTGGPVVLITGNGHAHRDWGVPAVLAQAAPELAVLSVGQLEAAPEGSPPYGHWLVTEPAPRDDPCAAFR